MSTRSTIKVYDKEDKFYIYRHYDGYPFGECGVLSELTEALKYAWPLPRFEAMDFAAAIIRAWKNGGGNIYFTSSHSAHWDTEYQYDVTMKKKEIWISVYEVQRVHPDGRRDIKKLFEGSLNDAIQTFAKPEKDTVMA